MEFLFTFLRLGLNKKSWHEHTTDTMIKSWTEANNYTNQLFSVAFSSSCWQPGVPGPAAEDLHLRYPSNLEPWLQHHLQASQFLTSAILSPPSLVQTILRETRS